MGSLAKKPNIMVVEDDEIFQMIYQASLKERCHHLHCATSLSAAREQIIAASVCYDLIILDNQLGDGYGVELVPLIKNAFPYCAILMISANADAGFLLRAFDSGIDDYMIKPVNYDLLWQKISAMVQRFMLQRLADEQQLALARWKESAQREQALASYLYDGFLHNSTETSASLRVWLQSSDSFSGDSIVQFYGLDGSQYVLIADAMGHGLAAAVSLMPMIRIFADKAKRATPLTQILYAMNDAGNSLLPDDRFVAAAVIRISPVTRQIEVWNGGLPAILITDRQGKIIHRCFSSHMPLGILEKHQFDASLDTYSISDENLVLAYTDGMIETPDADNNFLRESQIASLVAEDTESLSALKRHVMEQLLHPEDDISIGVIDCKNLLQQALGGAESVSTSVQDSQLRCHFRLGGQALTNTDVAGHIARLLRMQHLPTQLIQKVFTVLTELYVNALEHGVLQLDSRLKDEPEGFLDYYSQKESKLQDISSEHYVEIELEWCSEASTLRLRVEDSGRGIGWHEAEAQPSELAHGRGLSLVKQLVSSLKVEPPGNIFTVVFQGMK